MKAFWSDLFFDVNEGNSTEEEASSIAGESIRSTLIDIDNAIKNHEPKKAIEIIRDAINDF